MIAAEYAPPPLYERTADNTLRLNLHEGQRRVWNSTARFVFMIAGTQSGKTAFGPWWLDREIRRLGGGDYLVVTSTYKLFTRKLLPEMQTVFEHILQIGRYYRGAMIMEIAHPEDGFLGQYADDPRMYARVMLGSAAAKGGLESATAKAAWLDEIGQEEFTVTAWEAVLRRLSLHQGRVLGTTTPYNLGWLKQRIYDEWQTGNPDFDVIQFKSTLNPVFPEAEYRRAERDMPGWKFNMFYGGQFTKPAGIIYGDFIDDYAANGGHKLVPFHIPKHWVRRVGIDPGGANVGKLWAAHNPKEDIFIIYRESLSGDISTQEHADEIKELTHDGDGNILERVLGYYIGAKSESQQRRDFKRAGLSPVYEPKVSDVEAGIDRVIALLRQHRIFFFDDLHGILHEIATYQRELDEMNQPTDKIKDKSSFHLLDALRYLAQALYDPPEAAKKVIVRGRSRRRR